MTMPLSSQEGTFFRSAASSEGRNTSRPPCFSATISGFSITWAECKVASIGTPATTQ